MELLITIIAIALALALLNFTALPVFIGLENHLKVYDYISSDKQFRISELPEKGKGFEHVRQQFELYRWELGKPDIRLCRTFKKNYWKIWKWREYRTHERWALPYSGGRLPEPQ